VEITPLTRYREPNFPTREILDDHPELLRILPNRWRQNAVVTTALTAACSLAMMSAGRAHAAPNDRVAPIFMHGAGDLRGMFATMPTTSPIFLPEDEARLIIVEELKKAGLDITPDRPKLIAVSYALKDPKTEEVHREQHDLVLDGEDAERHVAYEYLSQDDWAKSLLWENASFQMREALSVMPAYAGVTRTAIAETRPDDRIAIFYDPAPLLGTYWSDVTPGLKTSREFSDATLTPLDLLGDGSRSYASILANIPGAPTLEVRVEKEIATIRCGGQVIVLTVDSDRAVIDGKEVILATKVVNRYGTVYFPLCAVLEALGFTVTWDEEHAQVTLAHPAVKWKSTSQVMQAAEEDPKQRLAFAFLRWDIDGRTAMAKELGREDLRRQVRDFITWLKAEGVI